MSATSLRKEGGTADDDVPIYVSRKDPQMKLLYEAAKGEAYRVIVEALRDKVQRQELKIGHLARAY